MGLFKRIINYLGTVFGSGRIFSGNKDVLAARGEGLACRYLKSKGYRILERSWRSRKYELDIIALKDGILVFAEVKTRSGDRFGLPEDAVNSKKQRRIISAAKYYLQVKKVRRHLIRFDILAILARPDEEAEINHIKNAFQARI
jgi:putative endonuclease